MRRQEGPAGCAERLYFFPLRMCKSRQRAPVDAALRQCSHKSSRLSTICAACPFSCSAQCARSPATSADQKGVFATLPKPLLFLASRIAHEFDTIFRRWRAGRSFPPVCRPCSAHWIGMRNRPRSRRCIQDVAAAIQYRIVLDQATIEKDKQMTAEWIECTALNVQTEAIKSLRASTDWRDTEQRAAGSASRHQYGAQRTRQGLRNLRRKLKSHTTGMRELRTPSPWSIPKPAARCAVERTPAAVCSDSKQFLAERAVKGVCWDCFLRSAYSRCCLMPTRRQNATTDSPLLR